MTGASLKRKSYKLNTASEKSELVGLTMTGLREPSRTASRARSLQREPVAGGAVPAAGVGNLSKRGKDQDRNKSPNSGQSKKKQKNPVNAKCIHARVFLQFDVTRESWVSVEANRCLS